MAGAGIGWRRALGLGASVTPLLRWVVLVHAVPFGQAWRTGCPHCGAALTLPAPSGPTPSPAASLPPRCPVPEPAGVGAAPAPDKAPATRAGALRPPGRCAGCRERIGASPYLLELAALATAGLVVAAVLGDGWPWPAVVALAGWAAVAVVLTFVDLAVHRLPDRLTMPAFGWVLAWLGVAALIGDAGGAWLRAAIAGLGCGLGFALVTLVSRGLGFGLGDAKLALGAGALLGWLGWTAVVAGLFLAFLTNGLVATGLLVARRLGWRDMQPFGPFLVGGTLATLAWAGLA